MIVQTKSIQAQRGKLGGKISNLTFINISMLGVLALVFMAASLIVPRFFSINNISNLVAQQAEIIILGIGVTFLLLTGYFDMSVGGTVGMAAVLSAYFCQTQLSSGSELGSGLGLSYGAAIVLTLVCCMLIGAINAFFIVRLRINSVVVTLGTMALARGIANIASKGAQRISGLPQDFKQIGQFTVIGTINLAVIIMVVLLVLALIIERKTSFGRKIYLIGANQVAAKLSGIKVEKEVSMLYVISAFLAGVTGIIMASRFNAGNCSLGTGYEFDALVVTVLGGTSIFGGFGSVSCAVVGAFIIGILSTSVNMLGFQPAMQYLVKGFVIVIAILAQRFALDRRNG
jgi:ribose transport system permease protein